MTSPAAILLVDDDADTRELLALVLSRDGCRTSQAGDTESALGLLRQGGFRLLITDYDLPDGTGGQLLQMATRERLLEHCAVLVVTGHPDPGDVGEAPVIAKPFDPEAIRDLVRHILAEPAAPVPAEAQATIQLVLYVARESPASRLAERNARRILEERGDPAVHLEVRDVAACPRDAEKDRILFVPTLVARSTPPVWVVGSLRNPAGLLGALAMAAAKGPARAT